MPIEDMKDQTGKLKLESTELRDRTLLYFIDKFISLSETNDKLPKQFREDLLMDKVALATVEDDPKEKPLKREIELNKLNIFKKYKKEFLSYG